MKNVIFKVIYSIFTHIGEPDVDYPIFNSPPETGFRSDYAF
jgi:hypothetical protein